MLLLIIIWKKIFNLFNKLVSAEAYFYFISLLIISTSVLNNINTILVVSLLILSLSLYFMFAYLFNDNSKKINIVLILSFCIFVVLDPLQLFLCGFFPACCFIYHFLFNKNKTHLYAAHQIFCY